MTGSIWGVPEKRDRNLNRAVECFKIAGEAFAARLFHFGRDERKMEAELYLLPAGKYTLSVHPEGRENAPGSAAKSFEVTGAKTRIAFTLPSRELCVLVVRQVE